MISSSCPRKEKVELLIIAPRDEFSRAAPRGFPDSPPREETRGFPMAEVCRGKPPRGGRPNLRGGFRMWSLRCLQIFPRVPGTQHLKTKLRLSNSAPRAFSPPYNSPPVADTSPNSQVCPSCQAGNERHRFCERLPDSTNGDKSHDDSACASRGRMAVPLRSETRRRAVSSFSLNRFHQGVQKQASQHRRS